MPNGFIVLTLLIVPSAFEEMNLFFMWNICLIVKYILEEVRSID